MPQFQELDSMFKNYTHDGCLFECKLKNSFKATGCIPWDYPIPPSVEDQANQIDICNSSLKANEISDLAKFDDYMNSANSTINCSCWSDCEEESFDVQVALH